MSAASFHPGRSRAERVAPWAVLAVLLAMVGVAASVWRPLAPPVPPVDTDLVTFAPEVMAAVEAYRGPRYLVAVSATLLGALVPVAVALTRRGRALVSRVVGSATSSRLRGALVAVVVSMLSSVATLPLAVWTRVVQDGRWGFRTQPWHGWAQDWLTVSAGTWATMGVLVLVLLTAVRRWPRSWPYRLTVSGSVIAVVVVVVHPLVLQPVLLPTTPLADAQVPAATAEILAEMGGQDLPVFVGEASARTTRVNAMVVGLGPTERVVLYDTLLELPPEQVQSIVAHELAHYEHRDLARGVLVVPTALLPGLLLLRAGVWSSGGRRSVHARGRSDPRLVGAVMAVVAVLELVGTPGANLLSRQAEAAADHRALEVTEEPAFQIAAARAFTVRDLADPNPPRWAQLLYGTHPTVAARIRGAVAWSDGEDLPERDDLEARERDIAHDAIRQGPP